jgi:hypothetical protein
VRVRGNAAGNTLETIVSRTRGEGDCVYEMNAGEKVYYLDTKERGRVETLQFRRGRKRLIGTSRTEGAAGGWCVAFH